MDKADETARKVSSGKLTVSLVSIRSFKVLFKVLFLG